MEEKESFYDVGNIKIADDVIATIANVATMEVEGVDSLVSRSPADIKGLMGMKDPTKGVKVTVEDELVTVDINVSLKYGSSIPMTAAAVQENVKKAVESMTGMVVAVVNVRVCGIVMPKTEEN